MLTLKYLQKIPLSLEKSWTFFSSPLNLKTLTPDYLKFEITNDLEEKKMYPGQMITYRIRPVFNLPVEWVTEITHVQEPHYFIDEQRVGPYKIWHHEHRFEAIAGGVEVIDTVYFKMPFGFLGEALYNLKVRKDLDAIFSYRSAKLEELFGPYVEVDSKVSTKNR